LKLAGIVSCVVAVAAVRTAVEPIAGNLTTNDTTYVASREAGGGPVVRYGFNLVARYHNPTKSPIYLARCVASSKMPLYDVQLVQGTRSSGSAYSPVWSCAAHAKQIVVKPGATRVDTLAISGPATWSGLTKKAIGVLEGRFRLGYSPQSCPGDGKCAIVADSLRYSNEFSVRLKN